MRGIFGTALALVLLAAAPAQASVFDELQGARSAAMGGAHRAVGTSNDTLYLNPAGMALAKRYNLSVNFAYSPFDKLYHFNLSAVDSKSGPVAAGLAYTHDRGDSDGTNPELHRILGAVAYPIGETLSLGISMRRIWGSFTEDGVGRDVSIYTGDAGMLLKLQSGLGIGVSANNLIKNSLARFAPLTVGGGIAYDSTPLVLAADFAVDLRIPAEPRYHFQVGGEYFIAGAFPIRLGYRRSPFVRRDGALRNENILTAGAGWTTTSAGIAVAATRSFERARNWGIVATIDIFL